MDNRTINYSVGLFSLFVNYHVDKKMYTLEARILG